MKKAAEKDLAKSNLIIALVQDKQFLAQARQLWSKAVRA